MKNTWNCLWLAVLLYPAEKKHSLNEDRWYNFPVSENLFIITTDGFRWQELFNGADSVLVNNDHYTPDKETIKALYWAESPDERRKKLMPFFWNVVAAKGQVYGNRKLGNKVDIENPYAKSYAGYSEIFTGFADPGLSLNRKINNPNTNVLEYLNTLPSFRNKVVVFSSWDVLPFILNEERSGVPVNGGYEPINLPETKQEYFINQIQQNWIYKKTDTRLDELTFSVAVEYIKKYRPKVVYISFGETDEFGHEGRYDLYLRQANKIDAMLADLWHLVQTTPFYKNKTTFIITTDHGRGNKRNKWTSHGILSKAHRKHGWLFWVRVYRH